MKLRVRIALLVTLTFMAVVLVLVAEATWRNRMLNARYQDAMQSGLSNAWIATSRVQLQRVQTIAEQISSAGIDVRAILGGDKRVLAESLSVRMLDLRALRIPVQVELLNVKGELLFSSTASRVARVLTKERMAKVGQLANTRVGAITIGTGEETYVALAAATPIFGRQGVIGHVAVWIDVRDLIGRFSQSIGWSVFLVRDDKSLIGAADGDATLWHELDLRGSEIAPFTVVHQGANVYEVVYISLTGMTSDLAGAIVALRSVTSTYWRRFTITAISFGLIIVLLILFLGFLLWYMRMSFRPLNAVIRVLNALARGDTEVRVETRRRRDEIGRLADTVESFRQAQVARMRLGVVEQDLTAAKQIQQAIQPSAFPASERYEIYAEIHTAREVGGDFYDFFELSDGRIGIVIADVSGKGMAAALFMAAARTAIRAAAQIETDPVACITRANDFLSHDNTALMFVTAFYVVFDPASGEITYTNAGHNPPYIVSSDRRRIAPLTGDTGIALGVAENATFQSATERLRPGEVLLLYTDGVTEAMNAGDTEFGEQRLHQLLRDVGPVVTRDVVTRIVAAVRTFAGSAPQSDDITCLALRRRTSASETETYA